MSVTEHNVTVYREFLVAHKDRAINPEWAISMLDTLADCERRSLRLNPKWLTATVRFEGDPEPPLFMGFWGVSNPTAKEGC
jgi:hypothetical protein